jgi:hypothetical protein
MFLRNFIRFGFILVYVKGKGHPIICLYRHKGEQRYNLLFFNLGTRREWVFSNMLWLLCTQERPGTSRTGGRVGCVASVDAHRKHFLYRYLIPGLSNH